MEAFDLAAFMGDWTIGELLLVYAAIRILSSPTLTVKK